MVAIVKAFDPDGDGYISFKEFHTVNLLVEFPLS